MKRHLLVAVLAAFSPVTTAVISPAAELTPKELAGTYRILSGEKYGQPSAKSQIEGVLVRFTEDAVVVTDTEKKEVYAASYKLDTGHKPIKILMTSTLESYKGMPANGFVEMDGETLKLVYSLAGGSEFPEGFKTRKKELMFVMKRIPD